jgi:hypothetical protein
MKTTVLRRSELYRQAWERTLAALGAEMGISDNGLKKSCTRHDIPRPPSGFFLMKPDKEGQYSRPLPNSDHDPGIQTTSQKPGEDDRVEAKKSWLVSDHEHAARLNPNYPMPFNFMRQLKVYREL